MNSGRVEERKMEKFRRWRKNLVGVQKIISGVQKRGYRARKLQRKEPYVKIPMEKTSKDEKSRKRNESKSD